MISSGKGICAAAVLLGVMSSVIWRERVVAQAPRTAVLFEKTGMPVNLDRLEIGPVRAMLASDDGRKTLLVETDIANPHATSTPLPMLRLTVRDAAGQPLYTWTASTGAKSITGGGRVPLRARLASPPAGTDVVVEFVRT